MVHKGKITARIDPQNITPIYITPLSRTIRKNKPLYFRRRTNETPRELLKSQPSGRSVRYNTSYHTLSVFVCFLNNTLFGISSFYRPFTIYIHL